MNERIQELAKRCYETGPIGKDGWPDYSKFNEEKFAKLIARDCAMLAMSQHSSTSPAGHDEMDPYDQGYEDAASVISGMIRKTFGVE